MLPGDIQLLTALSRPSIAPDGSFAVHASSRPDLRADRAVGQLWRTELAGAPGAGPAAPRRLTRGISDSAPEISPDGTTIAFLRPDARGRRQIHLVDARGGEPLVLTDRLLGVDSFAWTPDGTALVLTSRCPEPGRCGDVPGLPPEAERPRRITGSRWQANGVGYVLDRPAHVLLVRAVPVDGEPDYPVSPHPDGPLAPRSPLRAVQLTRGPAEHTAIAVSADGTHVLAVREDLTADAADLRNEVVAIPLPPAAEGPAPADVPQAQVLVPREAGLRTQEIGLAGDGAVLLLACRPLGGRDAIAPDVALWRLEEDGPRRLTDPETLDVGAAGSEIVALGEDVLLRAARRGRVHAVRVRPDGRVEDVVRGDVVARSVAARRTAGGEVVLAVLAAADSPGMLVRATADPAAPQVLVDAGAELRALAPPVRGRELEAVGRTGYPVHGWLTVPEHPADPGSIPLILMIHGGPYAAYDVAVLDEVQVLVEAGYAVVHGNPRGSAGYGRAHGRAVRGAFGTVDAQDVLDLLEAALAADGRLDAQRLGIMGGSYGGYLTAWIIAHEHRFRGAIVERGFLDPVSFRGTSDIGGYFGDQYIGTSPEDVERQSAFARAGQVRTPTLVIHSEQDLRCPLEQGLRYHDALRRAGVETEMLIFPGEDHELTRSGRPRHRVQRFEAVLEWWRRRLSPAAAG